MATISSLDHRASQNLPVPLGFSPEGVGEDLFDENTLYLIKNALPEVYYRVFVHLLYYATTDPRTTMQPSLFHKTGETQDEAIILYRSVADLSKSPYAPVGRETYHKAILIFEALKVFRRNFHRGFTEIRLPLGKREILIPELLESLRELHGDEKRKGYKNVKVKQLARKAAKRLQSGDFVAGIPRPSKMPEAIELKDVLQQLLLEHGISETQIQQSRLSQTCSMISQVIVAAKNGRLFVETGESAKEGTRKAWARPGDSLHQTGEFPSQQSPLIQTGATTEQEHMGDSSETKSPISDIACQKVRVRGAKKGDLDAIFGKKSPKRAENLLVSTKMGDSLPALSIIGSSSHVITSKRESTLIEESQETPVYIDPRSHREIESDARKLANRFDKGGGRRWPGSLYNAVKFTPPEIRRVAAIATHYYMTFRLPNGQDVKRPGALFTNTCKLYCQPGAEIPQDIRAWAETDLEISEIEIQLAKGLRHPGRLQLLPGRTEGQSEELLSPVPEVPDAQKDWDGAEQLEGYELPVSTCPPSGAYGWMDEREAQDLVARVEREKDDYDIVASVRPGEDGAYVVLTVWDGVGVTHQSAEEWSTYFEDVKSCL